MNVYEFKTHWPGRRQLTGRDLRALWRRALADGVDSAVFYDGLPDEDEFVALARAEENHFAVVKRNGEPLAFFWLNGQRARAAMLHFGFLKTGLSEKMEIGRAVLDCCFKGGFSTLLSLTPAYNLPAVEFGRALGGRVLGRLKDACHCRRQNRPVAGILLQFEREDS